LLNAGHPDNGGKAAFFGRLGFSRDDPAALINALVAVAVDGEVSSQVGSEHGQRYIIDGPISGPAGRADVVRTVWIIDQDGTTARLVTAYPGEE
jgi:hypothetical protein